MPYCFNCDLYDEKMETVCSDCSATLCSKCEYDEDVLCGCYGKCYSCDCDVNRGSDGWPCISCREWLCNDCKNSSECRRCGRGGRRNSDDDDDNDNDTDDETNNDTDDDTNDVMDDETNNDMTNDDSNDYNDSNHANHATGNETDDVVVAD